MLHMQDRTGFIFTPFAEKYRNDVSACVRI